MTFSISHSVTDRQIPVFCPILSKSPLPTPTIVVDRGGLTPDFPRIFLRKPETAFTAFLLIYDVLALMPADNMVNYYLPLCFDPDCLSCPDTIQVESYTPLHELSKYATHTRFGLRRNKRFMLDSAPILSRLNGQRQTGTGPDLLCYLIHTNLSLDSFRWSSWAS